MYEGHGSTTFGYAEFEGDGDALGHAPFVEVEEEAATRDPVDSLQHVHTLESSSESRDEVDDLQHGHTIEEGGSSPHTRVSQETLETVQETDQGKTPSRTTQMGLESVQETDGGDTPSHFSQDVLEVGERYDMLAQPTQFILETIREAPEQDVPPVSPHGFYFGDAGGNAINRFGQVHQDKGESFCGEILTDKITPAGLRGEAIYKSIFLTLRYSTNGEVTVTPIVDGDRLTEAAETVAFQRNPGDPVQKVYEIPLSLPHDAGSGELSRHAPRGCWLQVEVKACDLAGWGWIQVEGVEAAAEIVQERHPEISFVEEDLEASQYPRGTAGLYFGEAGGGRMAQFGTSRDDLGAAVEVRMYPNTVLPAGMGGECLFRNVYLAFQHANPTDVTFKLTPLVDDEPGTIRTVTLPGVTKPTSRVIEVPVTEAYDPGTSQELIRYARRGAKFSFEIESQGNLPDGDIYIAGAELEYELVQEGRVGVSSDG